MANDLKNIRLSAHATEIANNIKEESKMFDDAITVAKFALAYALKYFPEDLTDEKLVKWEALYDNNGSNYNIGTIDDDQFISKLITSLYPETNTPYRYARVIMCYGLNKLGDLQEAGRLFPLHQYM